VGKESVSFRQIEQGPGLQRPNGNHPLFHGWIHLRGLRETVYIHGT
jgi:hypothetical protein